MVRDGLGDGRSVAAHQVEHAARQPHRIDDLREDEAAERRDLARLQHDGAARRERHRDLRGDLVERVVPRRDAADDAHGLPDDERVSRALFELVGLRELRGRAERERREASLDPRGQGERHPDFARDRLRDLRATLGEAGLDLLEELAALGGWRPRPPVEGGSRGLHRAIDVRGVARGDAPDEFFGRGIDDVECSLARRLSPLTADVNLVVRLHGSLSVCKWSARALKKSSHRAAHVSSTRRARWGGSSNRVSRPINGFLESFFATQQTIEKLLALLEASEQDRFASHVYHSRREYRLVCQRTGKGNKQIERCIVSMFQVAESIGFKGDFRQWEHLLRIRE